MTIARTIHPNHLVFRGVSAAVAARGGPGSGFFGHPGRPGEVGGSAGEGGGEANVSQGRDGGGGGRLGEGKNGYIVHFKGKRYEVMSDTSYGAAQTLAMHLKRPDTAGIEPILAEKEGVQVTHLPLF